MCHWTGWPRYLDARGGESLASLVYVGHPDREVAKGAAQRVGFGLIPVVGQLDHGIVGLVAISDKGESELAGRVIAFAQQLHTEQLGIEIQRGVEIAHPDHRMQKSELVGAGDRL